MITQRGSGALVFLTCFEITYSISNLIIFRSNSIARTHSNILPGCKWEAIYLMRPYVRIHVWIPSFARICWSSLLMLSYVLMSFVTWIKAESGFVRPLVPSLLSSENYCYCPRENVFVGAEQSTSEISLWFSVYFLSLNRCVWCRL